MFRLSDGEEIITLAFFVLIQYRSVTDRRTDRQSDIPPLAIPAVCVARYANALVKMTMAHLSPSVDRDRPDVGYCIDPIPSFYYQFCLFSVYFHIYYYYLRQ